jgi:hypothetical protein
VVVGPLGPVPPLVDLAAPALGPDAVLGVRWSANIRWLGLVAEQAEAAPVAHRGRERAWTKLFQKFVS